MEFITNTIQWLISSPFICISWLIVGVVAGALARRIMGAKDYPIVQDFILGILGAIVGGAAVSLIGIGAQVFPAGGIQLVCANLIVATVGACILIGIRRAITGKN
jgi:uncharacterized membrane protein YeaQ/YmgE (transglycosylase-associated protein family)